MSKEILTTNQAAKLLGVARTSLINWISQGKLETATTPGGHRRFRRTDLLRFAESQGLEIQNGVSKTSPKMIHKVLIVDDDADFRSFAQDCLGLTGTFETKEAQDGLEAALIVGSWKPDLLLLDLNMPKMNGRELCEMLRKQDDLTDLKIVILTGYSEDEAEEELSGLEYDSILSKPIPIRVFVDHLSSLLAE